jgi:hypothetical protein
MRDPMRAFAAEPRVAPTPVYKLLGATLAALCGIHAILVQPPVRLTRSMQDAGSLLFWCVLPFGVLALHVLVHRGPLWRRLLAGLATTAVAFVAFWVLASYWTPRW